jgi:hypothetical protein
VAERCTTSSGELAATSCWRRGRKRPLCGRWDQRGPGARPRQGGGPAPRPHPRGPAPHRQLPRQQLLQLLSCHVLLRSALNGRRQLLPIPGKAREWSLDHGTPTLPAPSSPPPYQRSSASSRPRAPERARNTAPWRARTAAQRLGSSEPHSPLEAAMFARWGAGLRAMGRGLGDARQRGRTRRERGGSVGAPRPGSVGRAAPPAFTCLPAGPAPRRKFR